MRRYVGFGDQPDIVFQMVDQCPQEFDNLMRLVKMKTGRAGLFPQKPNRIQPEHTHALVYIKAQQTHKFAQEIGIGKIKVDLIRPEGAPDELFARRRLMGI